METRLIWEATAFAQTIPDVAVRISQIMLVALKNSAEDEGCCLAQVQTILYDLEIASLRTSSSESWS
jgi:hypothetical protein